MLACFLKLTFDGIVKVAALYQKIASPSAQLFNVPQPSSCLRLALLTVGQGADGPCDGSNDKCHL